MIRREQLFYFLFTQLFVFVCDQCRNVCESNMLRLRHLSSPLAEFSRTAFYMAIFPNVSHCQGENDRRRALYFRISDHLSHIPSVGVHNLVLLRKQIVDLLSLFAHTGKRAARARCVVNCPGVIMAELDQNKVASLHLAQDLVPKAFGYERSAAASSARSVENIDLFGVKVVDKRIAPTARSVGIVVGSRIADDEKRGQVRTLRSLFSRARLFVNARVLSLNKPRRNIQRDIN